MTIPDFPANHDVHYDATAGEWVGHWLEADPRFYAAAHERNGKRFIKRDADGTEDLSDPRCFGWVSLKGKITGPRCMRRMLKMELHPDACMMDWARLFPEEDLLSLRDPPRYSWRVPLGKMLGTPSVTAKHHWLRAAFSCSLFARFSHLHRPSCVLPACTRYIPSVSSTLACGSSPCPWCAVDELSLRVCCERAVPQLRPRLPLSMARAFFADTVCPGDCQSEGGRVELGEFDAYEALLYNFTCRPLCPTKSHFRPFQAIFATVPGAPPPPFGLELCPAPVTEIVCGYLGRNTLAVLLSPYHGYTCDVHPSGLDMLDGLRAPLKLSDATKRLQRIARVSHYNHTLSGFVLSHIARTSSLQLLDRHVRDTLSSAATVLATPMDDASANHGAVHKARLEAWSSLYHVYHDPEGFLFAVYERCFDGNCPAVWPLRMWPFVTRALCVTTTANRMLAPLRVWYSVPRMVHWPALEWRTTTMQADVTVGSFYVTFAALHGVAAGGFPWCQRSCVPPFFTSEIAAWVTTVCATTYTGRKRARRSLMMSDPWSISPENTRTWRHAVPYMTESDSDATEPYSPTPHPNYPTGDTTEDEMPPDFSPTRHPDEHTDTE